MALPGTAIVTIGETAKLALQIFFALMRLQGKTDEEIDAEYEAEKARKEEKGPRPEVPE